MSAGVRCPHCDEELTVAPSRSTGCHHCGQPIPAETNPSKHSQPVMKPAQPETASQTPDERRQDLRTLGTVNLAQRERERQTSKRSVPVDDAPTKQPSAERISQRSTDPYERKMAALQAAWGAALQGEDYSPYVSLLHSARLEEIIARTQRLGVRHVRIVASGPGGDCCTACHQMDGQVVAIESESTSPSLPVRGCTCTASGPVRRGFCLCYYEPVLDDKP